MVEQVEGKGRHFREVIQSINREGPQFRTVVFRQGEVELYEEALMAVRANPDWNSLSVVLNDVVDVQGKDVKVLSGPKGLPQFHSYKDSDNLPREGQTHVVDVWTPNGFKQDLVLVDNPRSAERIAKRKIREKGVPYERISATARKVSTQTFVELAKQMIDEGHGSEISAVVKGYAGLAEYERQHRLNQRRSSD